MIPRSIRAKEAFLVSLLSIAGTCAAWTTGTDSLGAVSSESRLCSEIGIELLKRGVSCLAFNPDLETDHMTREMRRMPWLERPYVLELLVSLSPSPRD